MEPSSETSPTISRKFLVDLSTWIPCRCTVWADAPGYMALMVICGGAMGGYWETGRILIASRPASMTMMAITTAKIGRFIKNLGIMISFIYSLVLLFLAPTGFPSALVPKGTALTGLN